MKTEKLRSKIVVEVISTTRPTMAQEGKPQTATLFTDLDGVKHPFVYTSTEDLLQQVYNFFEENEDYLYDDDNWITLPNGEVLTWSHTYAYYHYSKGGLDFEKFLDLLKGGAQ